MLLTYDLPVESIQWALRTKGHDPGRIDGVLGETTRDAIRQWQRAAQGGRHRDAERRAGGGTHRMPASGRRLQLLGSVTMKPTTRGRALALTAALTIAAPTPADEHEQFFPADAITAEVIAMHAHYYGHSMDAFNEMIGETMLSVPNLMFSVFTPQEQRRLCALMVDYSMMRLVAGEAMRRAVFSSEGYHRVVKGSALVLAGFEPDDTGQWTEEEQSTIIESGLGGLKRGNEFDHWREVMGHPRVSDPREG